MCLDRLLQLICIDIGVEIPTLLLLADLRFKQWRNIRPVNPIPVQTDLARKIGIILLRKFRTNKLKNTKSAHPPDTDSRFTEIRLRNWCLTEHQRLRNVTVGECRKVCLLFRKSEILGRKAAHDIIFTFSPLKGLVVILNALSIKKKIFDEFKIHLCCAVTFTVEESDLNFIRGESIQMKRQLNIAKTIRLRFQILLLILFYIPCFIHISKKEFLQSMSLWCHCFFIHVLICHGLTPMSKRCNLSAF